MGTSSMFRLSVVDECGYQKIQLYVKLETGGASGSETEAEAHNLGITLKYGRRPPAQDLNTIYCHVFWLRHGSVKTWDYADQTRP
jgi:hypothetical protein